MRYSLNKDINRYLEDFLDYLESTKDRSPGTVKEYYYDIRTFLRFMKARKFNLDLNDFDNIEINKINKEFIESITKQDIYSYSSYLDKERNNSSRTKFRKLSSVRSFFNYLCNKIDLIKINPAENLDMPKIKKSLPVYMSLEESIKLIKTIESSKQRDLYRKRDYAIVLLFLNTGLRLSELSSINVEDIQKNKTIKVMGKGSKERLIYLNETCLNAIESYLSQRQLENIDNKALFLSMRKNRMNNRSIQHMIEKHLKNAGFDTKKYSVHKLRHTAATLMYQFGDEDIKTLQEILGHESISTTQIYTHVDEQDIKHVMSKNPLANIKELDEMKKI